MQTIKNYYLVGTLEYRFNYLNGNKHGLNEYWYLNGNKQYKENYINNEKHGRQEYWKDNNENFNVYYKYGRKITKKDYEEYLDSIKRGILNILSIGKNTLDLIITRYLI